jgi:uncharacterized metal-binding protein YceD (DUF177 family)
MKIHTLQIPPEGKHFEGEDPAGVLDLQDPSIQPTAPLAYSLDVGLSDGGLFATGRIQSAFRLQCVKCLESFEYPVVISDFACQVEIGSSEEVDLTESLREDIVLALPAHPHCDWNGLNPCSGLRLPPEEPVQTETPKPVWDALDRLKL